MANKIVLFDLDDTLYKEIDFVKSAYKYIADYLSHHHNIDNTFQTLWDTHNNGENAFDRLLDMIGTSTIDIPALLKLYREHFPIIELSEDVSDTLSTLKLKGATLGIITDGRSLTQRNKLKALGLDKYFDNDNIIISQEFGSEKDNAANFEFFVTKFGASNDFYFIGDNPKKDFFHPNIMGWTTICLKDDGRNIHPHSIELDDMSFAQQTLCPLSDIIPIIYLHILL